jgi:catalase
VIELLYYKANWLFKKAKAGGGDSSNEEKHYKQAHEAFFSFISKPEHKPAAVFVQSERPNTHNYGTITYYEPNAHILTNKDGKVMNIRYRLDLVKGENFYPKKTPKDKQKLAQLKNNYLKDNLQQRFLGRLIVLTIQAHIAGPDIDVCEDRVI